MRNKIRIDLRIVNSPIDPSEITNVIGLQPTRTWLEDELIHPNGILRHKGNGWELSSGIDGSKTFEEHLNVLGSLIANHSAQLMTWYQVANATIRSTVDRQRLQRVCAS